MIEIEKGIPLPERKGPYKTKPTKYPYRTMEVGDSFLVPEPPKTFRAQVNNWGRSSNGKKFAYRTTPEGLRVWRIK